MIKLFEEYSEIESICKKYNIEHYSINSDGSIDVDAHVDLSCYNLVTLPLKFGRVTGNFNCSDNDLISLEGCPRYVGMDFICSYNKLTSLKGCPINKVGWRFSCSYNKITSLEGCPEVVNEFLCVNNELVSLKGSPKYINGNFYCSKNKITSLEGGPISVSDKLYCDNNELTSLKGCPDVRNIFCDKNNLRTLDGCPKNITQISFGDNPLPQEIYFNRKYINKIIEFQDDYSIWNNNKLNKDRFKFEVYGNYLLWMVALALFNAILPMKQTNIFECTT